MVLDENENSHYGNTMVNPPSNHVAVLGTHNAMLNKQPPNSSYVNNHSPSVHHHHQPPMKPQPQPKPQPPSSYVEDNNHKDAPHAKKPKSRAEHQQKILELCQEKLSSSAGSKAIVASIKDLYKTKILPLEKKYHLHSLCLPTSGAIQDSEFDARPMVLLLGQYSTGKTSFIRHLLGVDFPGMHM